MVNAPDQVSIPTLDGTNQDVRVSCLIVSAAADDADRRSRRSRREDQNDGPPSVIETFSRSDVSPSILRGESTLRDDDDDDDDDLSETGGGARDSDEEGSDDSEEDSCSEGEEIEVLVDGSVDDTLSTKRSDAVARPPAVAVKTIAATIGGDMYKLNNNFMDTQNNRPRESLLPVLKGFLFVALLPACSYVLKEATFVAREFSISERSEEDNLVKFLVGLNTAFAVSVFLGILSVLWNPSRLDKIVAPLQ